MERTTREYQAIVWFVGSGASTPPQRIAVTAHDESEARKLIIDQFGDEIRCSIWNQEDAHNRWPHANGAGAVRTYKAVVWTKEVITPGQRVTVEARSLDEARARVVELFGEEMVCSIWNEDDANQVR